MWISQCHLRLCQDRSQSPIKSANLQKATFERGEKAHYKIQYKSVYSLTNLPEECEVTDGTNSLRFPPVPATAEGIKACLGKLLLKSACVWEQATLDAPRHLSWKSISMFVPPLPHPPANGEHPSFPTAASGREIDPFSFILAPYFFFYRCFSSPCLGPALL